MLPISSAIGFFQWQTNGRKSMLPIGSAIIRSALRKEWWKSAIADLPPSALFQWQIEGGSHHSFLAGASGRWRNF
jgi:hypothetical protein